MTGPLSGIRIVDASAVLSGPLAIRILADQGAEVIKIEVPGQGDVLRYVGSSRNGMTASFHMANRGKRSIALNLGHERGVEILKDLVREADVFIQNWRPGVADRLGIGWENLREINYSQPGQRLARCRCLFLCNCFCTHGLTISNTQRLPECTSASGSGISD